MNWYFNMEKTIKYNSGKKSGDSIKSTVSQELSSLDKLKQELSSLEKHINEVKDNQAYLLVIKKQISDVIGEAFEIEKKEGRWFFKIGDFDEIEYFNDNRKDVAEIKPYYIQVNFYIKLYEQNFEYLKLLNEQMNVKRQLIDKAAELIENK